MTEEKRIKKDELKEIFFLNFKLKRHLSHGNGKTFNTKDKHKHTHKTVKQKRVCAY